MLQHELRRLVGFVEGFEQARHEVGCARATDADDAGIAVGQSCMLAGSAAASGSKRRSRQYPADAGERGTIVSGGSSLVK
jgi:hypothetical protein